jgi:hypothetical protein
MDRWHLLVDNFHSFEVCSSFPRPQTILLEGSYGKWSAAVAHGHRSHSPLVFLEIVEIVHIFGRNLPFVVYLPITFWCRGSAQLKQVPRELLQPDSDSQNALLLLGLLNDLNDND